METFSSATGDYLLSVFSALAKRGKVVEKSLNIFAATTVLNKQKFFNLLCHFIG